MFTKLIKKVKYHKLINKAKSYFENNNSNNIIGKPTNLKELTKWYSSELLYTSREIDNLEKENNIVSTCSKGCNHCCKQAIFINQVEFEILQHYIQSLDNITKEKIKYKSNNIQDRISKTTIPMSFSNPLSMDRQQEINKEYFSKGLMCPLSSKEGKCLIYHIRPLMCLTYRSYGDKRECARTYTPEFGHAYISCDDKIRSKMDLVFKSEKYRLLSSALSEMLYHSKAAGDRPR